MSVDPGFLVTASLRGPDAAERAERVLDLLAGRAGFRWGRAGESVEDDTAVLVTEWDGAGFWRRAVGAAELRAQTVPYLHSAGPACFLVRATR